MLWDLTKLTRDVNIFTRTLKKSIAIVGYFALGTTLATSGNALLILIYLLDRHAAHERQIVIRLELVVRVVKTLSIGFGRDGWSIGQVLYPYLTEPIVL